ncbi:MAG: tetratricopeptide repeat protein [Methylotenera sp.]
MSANQNPTSATQEKLHKLNQYLAEDPRNLNLLAEVIDLNIYLKNYIEAKAKIIDALAIEKDNPYFKLRLSTILIAEGDYQASIDITKELLDTIPDEPAIKFNHGYALALNEQFSEAKEPLLQLFQSQHSFQLLPATLIRTLHHLGDLDEAIAVANTYLESHPEDGQVAGMLSLIYFDNDDFDNAQATAINALKLAPDNLDALMSAAGSYIGDEKIEEASELLNHALTIDPNNGRALAKVGLIDMLNQDLSSAEAHMQEALKAMPEHIGSWHVLGWIQILQQRTNEAEKTFTHALELDRNFGESHAGLGVIEALKGNWKKADEYCNIAKKLDGNVMAVHYVALLKLQAQGKSDSATQLLNKVMQSNKLPNGDSFQDFLNKVSSRSFKK